jgi:hypothetical protein
LNGILDRHYGQQDLKDIDNADLKELNSADLIEFDNADLKELGNVVLKELDSVDLRELDSADLIEFDNADLKELHNAKFSRYFCSVQVFIYYKILVFWIAFHSGMKLSPMSAVKLLATKAEHGVNKIRMKCSRSFGMF